MTLENAPLLAFNRGVISPLALARTDLKRTALSSEIQTNWMARILGAMMLRAGTGYTTGTLSNNKSLTIPFIFSGTDMARLELTDSNLRPLVNDQPITRASVATAITNPTFTSGGGGWTSYDETGATSTMATKLELVGTGIAAAIREQAITIAGGDQTKEQALRIIVTKGLVTFRMGSASGTQDIIAETTLGVGTHSLAFTPGSGTGTVYARLSSIPVAQTTVTSVTIEAAGVLLLPTPWLVTDLPNIRWDASADITYLACYGYQQRKIERRSTTSWSVVLYQPVDGPFRVQNTTPTSITPSATSGDITMTASRNIFNATHVGALWKLTSIGQVTNNTITGQNQFGDYIEVLGTGTQRYFYITITGTWSGTVQLQQSIGAPGAWVNITAATYTTNQASVLYNDALAGQTIYYRLGITTGNYTSGSAVLGLSYSNGSNYGIVRISSYTSGTSVTAEVLDDLGSTTGTTSWEEGEWSNFRGWPSENKLFEGRLFHLGQAKVWGSLPDAYESFDETVIGDGGFISRTYGKGPVDKTMWCLGLQRLLIGGEVAEWSIHTSNIDDPLTPTNFSARSPSSQGSSGVPAIQVDTRALFVPRCGNRLFQLAYNNTGGYIFDYTSSDLSQLCPQLLYPGIVKIVVQRKPDTRIHCILADGTVAILIDQPEEDENCWVLFSSPNASVEDAMVLPGTTEDSVYYTINRTVNGSTVRYHEKWAFEANCQGGLLNEQADSYITYTGVATTTITAAHLKGQTVICWGDGAYLGTAVADISTGVVTLPNSASCANIMVGLGYGAIFKSSKLAYGAQMGTALTMKKRVDHLGLILYNTHYQGIQYGTDLTKMQSLPLMYKGAPIAANTVFSSYDVQPFEFQSTWDSDARLYLTAQAPLPCTVLAAVPAVVTNG